MFQWGCLAEGLHLAPAHPLPRLLAPCLVHEVLFSWQARHPSHLPPCCGCDFTVAFSSPACVSHRGCFHFYSRKKTVPGALAAARAQCHPPPRVVQCQVLWGGQVLRCQPWP